MNPQHLPHYKINGNIQRLTLWQSMAMMQHRRTWLRSEGVKGSESAGVKGMRMSPAVPLEVLPTLLHHDTSCWQSTTSCTFVLSDFLEFLKVKVLKLVRWDKVNRFH